MERPAAGIGARYGQPAEADGEDQNQHRAEREAWHGEAEERDDREKLVEPAAAAHCGEDSCGQREGEAEAESSERERQRIGIARGDERGHGCVQADGAA